MCDRKRILPSGGFGVGLHRLSEAGIVERQEDYSVIRRIAYNMGP